MTKLPIKEKVEEIMNLDPLSSERKENVLNTALKLIDLRSLNRILDDLKQDERDQLSLLINEGKSKEVVEYIENKGFDFAKIIREETEKAEKKFEEVLDDYKI